MPDGIRPTFHEDLRRDHAVAGSSDRSFGLTFAAVFVALACFHWATAGATAGAYWWLAGAAAFLGAAVLRPVALAPLNRLWLRFGLLLHRIVSPLIMGVLFFGVFTPIGAFRRLVSRDPLSLRRNDAASYWVGRPDAEPPSVTMRNQF